MVVPKTGQPPSDDETALVGKMTHVNAGRLLAGQSCTEGHCQEPNVSGMQGDEHQCAVISHQRVSVRFCGNNRDANALRLIAQRKG